MKDEVMQKLGAVLNALNDISVSGKSNLGNLAGSIAMLEEIASELNECTIEKATSKK